MPMLSRALCCSFLLTLCYGGALAQNRQPQTPIAGTGSEPIMTGTPEAEMLARRDIKAAEKERLENLERAREAAQLGTEIHTAFTKNQTLSRTEIKKIERLVKLTRRIREEAGGSDGDVTLENPPRQLEAALQKTAELAEEICKAVIKTPRQVISAAVIERTNELLEIIRYVRSFTRATDQSSQ